VSQITFDEKVYPTDLVVQTLAEQVLPERLKRIQQVVSSRSPHLIPVMENIYDRGNTSAVMRSAEAFGYHLFHQVVSINEFKESKRVTQGADKWLLQTQWETPRPCIDHLKSQGYQVAVTHLDGGLPIDAVDFTRPTALIFGSERDGASPEITAMADFKLYIPMRGFVQSFNISVAAALCFQHARREQDQAKLPLLSDEERQHLLALYLYRSLKNPVLPSI
jgi:tRNA (guanosine-2'-O-)-methyltransferase